MLPWHKALLRQLWQRFSQAKLHHGLMLVGSEGAGSVSAAQSIAEMLLCQQPNDGRSCGQCSSCLLMSSGNHPDLHRVTPENSIGIDQIRGAISKLNDTAHSGGAKVLVITHAEKMTEASANALLKTLEEPTSHTYLLLVTEFPQMLLSTVRSRCEKILLPKPSRQDSQAWLREQGVDSLTPALMELYGSEPLTIKSLLESGEGESIQKLSQELDDTLQGRQLSIDFAESWAGHEQVVYQLLMQRFKPQLQSLTNETYQGLSQFGQKLRLTGTNKALMTSQLIEQLRLV